MACPFLLFSNSIVLNSKQIYENYNWIQIWRLIRKTSLLPDSKFNYISVTNQIYIKCSNNDNGQVNIKYVNECKNKRDKFKLIICHSICKYRNSSSFVGNMTCYKVWITLPFITCPSLTLFLLEYQKQHKRKNNFYSYMSSQTIEILL